MPSVISLGEALIDMVSLEKGVSLEHAPGFEKAAGGAPANVAAGVAILGTSAGFIGKVGDDFCGRFLRETLYDVNVDVANFILDPAYRTQLAFVTVLPDGSPDFTFYVERSADMTLSPDELDEAYIAEADIFHFGSITLINEPSRSATLGAIEVAAESGALISYDPNLRLRLWPDEATAKREITAALELCDVVKMSETELEFITGSEDLSLGAAQVLERGPELVVVTLGPQGCYFDNREAQGTVAGFEVPVEDTTGCGDAFVAATLVMLLEHMDRGIEPGDLTKDQLERIFLFANAAGALTATGKGAIASLPTREEVEEFLRDRVPEYFRGGGGTGS
jgi:fructokinase